MLGPWIIRLPEPGSGDMNADAGAQPGGQRRDVAQEERRMLEQAKQPESHGDRDPDPYRHRKVPRQVEPELRLDENREETDQQRGCDEDEDAERNVRGLESLLARHAAA